MWSWLKSYLIYFLTGGIFTVLIVALEENGSRLLSGFATLMPVFTLVAYIFIGETQWDYHHTLDTKVDVP